MQPNTTESEAHANQVDFTWDLSGVLLLFATCGDVFRHQTALELTCIASGVSSQHGRSFLKWFRGSELLMLLSLSISLSLSQNQIYILMSFEPVWKINQLKRSMFSCSLLLNRLCCITGKEKQLALSALALALAFLAGMDSMTLSQEMFHWSIFQ